MTTDLSRSDILIEKNNFETNMVSFVFQDRNLFVDNLSYTTAAGLGKIGQIIIRFLWLDLSYKLLSNQQNCYLSVCIVWMTVD